MTKRVMGVQLPAVPAEVARHAAEARPVEPPPRSVSPVGTARIQTPWGSMSAPGPTFLLALLIIGVLVAIVWFVRGEVRSIRDELVATESRAKARDEATQRQLVELRNHLTALQLYTEQSVGLTAQVVRRLGGKLEFAPGTEPEVEFHPPPLAATRAAPVQPRAVLPPPPPPPPSVSSAQ